MFWDRKGRLPWVGDHNFRAITWFYGQGLRLFCRLVCINVCLSVTVFKHRNILFRYHHDAFYVAQATTALANFNSSVLLSWMHLVFLNQPDLLSTESITPNEAKHKLALLASDIGVPERVIKSGLLDRTTDLQTRANYKFGCSRAVTGTPQVSRDVLPLQWLCYSITDLLYILCFVSTSAVSIAKELCINFNIGDENWMRLTWLIMFDL